MAFTDLSEGILGLFGEAQGFGDASVDFNRARGFSRFSGSCAVEYAQNKADGICAGCKKRPARPGRVTCQKCREYQTAWRRANPTLDNAERLRALRSQRKLVGTCLRCPAKARPGSTTCEACVEYQRNWRHGPGRESTLQSQRVKRQKLIAQGRCYCGRPRDREDRKCCSRCIEVASKRQRARA